ncbi:NAD(P)/FAD-dependent oxidoreductase [Reyranella sp.]|uniref:flavin-containing monooxygenase n=1 Tax=Reyranella sp. TaxID=1929291 RepID=UPI002723E39E|nr:NAD(P)/FAD-dependent oxidoreductase [Reyranella sp.]MDO8976713.1 NAD(P)/FAD-dependent oxidoreductase [Reyranella sp.]
MGASVPGRASTNEAGIECDVVVVGAGFGGLYALHRMREIGLAVRGIEAAPDVGGTWYWNRYPGARCDVPSLFYSYSWSPELRREWRWTNRYAGQEEILNYARFAADRLDLRRLIQFDTRVAGATFDEPTARWVVETDRGDRLRARFVIMATGGLSVPNTPDIPGVADFAGEIYHTARWPQEPVDFEGKRVGIIGTGSSGVQAIPMIAKAARQLVVFQRTPNFSVPAHNRPLTDEDHRGFDDGLDSYLSSLEQSDFGRVPPTAFTAEVPPRDVQWARYEQLWREGGSGGFLKAFPNILVHPDVNEVCADFVRQKIRETVKDPKTAETLSPSGYPFGVKRLCVDTDYFDTYNRPNVELVNLREEPIEKITANAVDTAARHFDLDALVFATGFDAVTGALLAVDIRGREGATLKDAWSEGPRTYLGLTVAGFPNLFTITGPGSPSVIGNVITNCEYHVDWIAECLTHMRRHDLATIEPDGEAQIAWGRHVAEVADRTLFPKANSWYLGVNIPGKPRVFMPYIGEGYRTTCKEIVADGYRGFRFGGSTRALGEAGK